MTRTELFREKRKGIAKTEYMIMERINDLSDQIETLTKRLDDMSEHLYYFAKTDNEEFKNAFDEQFKESLKEYEKWIGGTEWKQY